MSTPILPFEVWESGTNQNSIPANDNALRWEILNGLVIAADVVAQPATPDDGDIYVIPAGATGVQWASFDPNDLALFRGGTWYAYAPVAGITINLAGALYAFNGTAYEPLGGGGGAPAAADVTYDNSTSGLTATDVQGAIDEIAAAPSSAFAPVATFAGTAHEMVAGDVGAYTRLTNASAKSWTVQPDATEPMPANAEVHLRNVGAGVATLAAGSGVTLNAPAGGTLAIPQGGTVTLKRAAADEWDVLGATVPA